MLNNRLTDLFASDKKLFSIFVTAGFPTLDATVPIVETLASSGVDLIELGIPFSDSIADGATIQRANETALRNGASLRWTLDIVRQIRERGVRFPIVLMGSLNPILQYGVEEFCAAAAAGADGLILPDLPPEFYLAKYREIFEKHNLANIFLVTSNTAEARIRQLDQASNSFIYAVSLAGVTGKTLELDQERRHYLERLQRMNLRAPLMIGFGIENKTQFDQVARFASGAIVGSAFLRALENESDVCSATKTFVEQFVR